MGVSVYFFHFFFMMIGLINLAALKISFHDETRS